MHKAKNSTTPDHHSFSYHFKDAMHYWEKRRFVFNAILISIVLIWLIVTWPDFRGLMNPRAYLLLLFLGVIANTGYSVAYLIDIPLQYTSYKDDWRQKRWVVWWAGLVLAIILANYLIAYQIYPYFHG